MIFFDTRLALVAGVFFLAACGSDGAASTSGWLSVPDAEVLDAGPVEEVLVFELPEAPPDPGPPPAETLADDLVYIPPGSFIMGSPGSESGMREGSEGQRPVVITRGFLMMRHEVTVGQWFEATGQSPSQFNERDDLPAQSSDWVSAAAFANWRSDRESLERCYRFTPTDCADDPAVWGDGRGAVRCGAPPPADLGCLGYRLPSEAEWEYAARAGTTTATFAGDLSASTCECELDPVLSPIAWSCRDAYGDAQPVMQKQPNAFGLHDTLGSLWEWTNDWYQPHEPSTDVRVDPVGPSEGEFKVGRGGAWGDCPVRVRAAIREYDTVDHRGNIIGLRLVRGVDRGI
jgi:formylglycine-generating enzyme required for sulfatase activity